MSTTDTTDSDLDSDAFSECTACGLEGSRDIVVAHDCPEDSPARQQPGALADGEPVGWMSDTREGVEILCTGNDTEWYRINANVVVDSEVWL